MSLPVYLETSSGDQFGNIVLLPITCSSLVQKVSDDDSLRLVTENLDEIIAPKSL